MIFDESHRHDWLSRLGRIIRLAPLLMILGVASVFAHDPGLSAAEVTLDGDKAIARLTFSQVDIETLHQIDSDHDGRITQSEFGAARPALESLAKDSFSLSLNGKEASEESVAVSLDESGTVHFDLKFSLSGGSSLTMRSLLIGKLPYGHRQFVSLHDADGNVLSQRMLNSSNNSIQIDLSALSSSRPHTFWGFIPLGIEHIWLGYDHLAFLFALLIMGGTLREAAKIITSFTAAHSITLALATLQVIVIPSRVVEPLIAASIVYVGLENILRSKISRRWLLTFAFGLIHGFGFASALRDLGVGAGVKAIAPLLSFNLGVEMGQVAVAAVILPLIWKLRERPLFVLRYVPACSILVALAGGYWLLERTLLK